jgi:NitT/TauT family transport system ATP-binding protein
VNPGEGQGGQRPTGAQPEPMIRLEGLEKRFPGAEEPAVRELSIDVPRGEIAVLVGPSGCGKTTLLRCLDGLLPLSEGEIRIEGEPLDGPRPGVAMVFQHFGLFPWKTVYQNVAYGLRLAGASAAEIREKVPRFIQMVGLSGFEGAYPYQLSGGMQQRCGLARALALEPHVLLMDEPFAAIDAQTREILQFELLRIWEMRPTSMVFVTHSIDEAVLMGDRVVVLKGRPSTVHETIEVNLPRPRSRATLGTGRFSELREHVWNNLKDEARRAEFEMEGLSRAG